MSRLPIGRVLAVAVLTLVAACGNTDPSGSSRDAPSEGLSETARDTPSQDPTAGTTDGDPMQWSATVAPSGPGLGSQQAIDQVLETLGSDLVTGIEPDAVPAPGNSNIPGLVVQVRGDGHEPTAEMELMWLAAISGGAVADLMRTDEVTTNQLVDRLTATEQLPSGRTKGLGGGMGAVAAGQVFEAQIAQPDDDEIIDHVNETLEGFGLSPTSVTVLHPLGPAIEVVAALPEDATVDWTLDELREAISGDPRAYEGLLIEIDSSTGSPLIIGTVAYRTTEGGLWFADGQDEVFGAVHGGLAHLPRSQHRHRHRHGHRHH